MNNIVESLRALFEKLGGSASAEPKETIAAAIDQITTVASSGGGGGSTETVEGTIGSTAKDGELYFGSFVNEKAAIITTESELTINGYPLTPVTEDVNKPTFFYNLDLETFTPTGAPAYYVEVDTNSVTIGSSEDLAGENVVLAVKVSGGSNNILVATATVTNPDQSTMTAVFNKTFGDVYNAVSTGVPVFFIVDFNEGMPVYFPFAPESVVNGEQIMIAAHSRFMGNNLSFEAQGAASANVTATISVTEDAPAIGYDFAIRYATNAWSVSSEFDYEDVQYKISTNKPVNVVVFDMTKSGKQIFYHVMSVEETGVGFVVVAVDPLSDEASSVKTLLVSSDGTVTEQT